MVCFCPSDEVYETFLKTGPGGTLDEAFTIIAWSFNALMSGKWPSQDWTGRSSLEWIQKVYFFFVSFLQDFLHTENLQEFWGSVLFSIFVLRYKKNSLAGRRANTWLANGFRAVITGVLGDLDYLAGTLQLPRWSKAHNSCCLCLCSSSGENSWKIFKEDAPWIQKIWTPSTWEAWVDKSPCKLFAHTKHLTACSVQSDWMHAKYLGVDMVTFASILWLCMYVVGPDSPNENLQAFERHLKEFYKNNRVDSRYSHFNTFRFFQNQKGLKLKGKAAQIKEFGRPLLSFWEKLHNEELRVHKLILVYLKLNVKLENILDDNKKEIYLSDFTSTEKKHILWKNFKQSLLESFYHLLCLRFPGSCRLQDNLLQHGTHSLSAVGTFSGRGLASDFVYNH